MKDLIKLYEEIYSLSLEQKKIIMKDDYIALLEVLEKKQKLIDKIDKINVEDYIKTQEKPEEYFETLKAIIKQAKELEDENAELIKSKHGDMKEKLQDINIKQKSRKGYQGNNKYEAKFIDKKG